MEPVVKLESVPRGERRCFRVPITETLGGERVSLAVHAVRGVSDGPTLALLSALHGDEWFGSEFMRRLVTELDPGELRGTLLVVPVGNPPALQMGTRTVEDEAGGTDINRAFPGRTTLVTDRLAAAITREVLARTDALLDFHQGDWGVTWASVGYPTDLPDPAVVARAEAMATAFGFPCVHRTQMAAGGRAGTACGYAGVTYGVPSLAVSLGGPGFGEQTEEGWILAAVAGIRNVMHHLGLLEGPPPAPPRRLVFEQSWYVRPSVGGILHPALGVDRLLTEVAEGAVLGRVVSPHTFEVLEELVAPKPGVIHSLSRTYPVHPGNWAFAAADLTHAATRWIGEGAR